MATRTKKTPVADFVETLGNEIDSERQAKIDEFAARTAKLDMSSLKEFFVAGMTNERTAKRSWLFLGDQLIMRGFTSKDIFKPSKEQPATEELTAIRTAIIDYGFPKEMSDGIKLPARQRVIYGPEMRQAIMYALDKEIPDFLKAIKNAMRSVEERGPNSGNKSMAELLVETCEEWIKKIRKADDKKIDFDCVDVIGALKDVINAVGMESSDEE